jgi:hypothetical protein
MTIDVTTGKGAIPPSVSRSVPTKRRVGVRARDLPLLRDQTATAMEHVGHLVWNMLAQRMYDIPSANRAGLSTKLGQLESRRLRYADLFYVSEQMSTLAHAAAASMPDFALSAEDAPTQYGLIYFAEPLNCDDVSDDGRPVAPMGAATWEIVSASDSSALAVDRPGWRDGGVWLTWYLDRDGALDQAKDASAGTPRELIKLAGLFARTPGLLMTDATWLAFGEDSQIARHVGTEKRPIDVMTDPGVGRWIRVLKATWLLMAQPLAITAGVEYDRAAKRRYARVNEEPPPVRVITLRRPANSAESGPSDREYHHQWIVRGHWRQQWYPSREVHRPVWIAPHIKGPDGAPLIGGEKVYAWTR